jgi:hypothetical protein
MPSPFFPRFTDDNCSFTEKNLDHAAQPANHRLPMIFSNPRLALSDARQCR